MIGSDFALLQQYVKERSETAFNELVQRHLPIVYSAALRQVRSPELAEEVAQSVFADLAKNASRLKTDTILSAWLYQVTRRTAIDCIRQESRRQLREQTALQMAHMNSDSTEWTQVEPLLDEGMEILEEQDRAAILLRYFENKSLREVGNALGVSDDAAQKRVSRAVERLRDYFSRKGVAITTSSLTLLLSAHSIQAVPVGLAFKIFSFTTLAGTALAVGTKAITMTTLQKTVVTLAFAGALGTGIYQAQKASGLRTEVELLRSEQSRLLENERDNFAAQLAELRSENDRLGRNSSELLKLRGEVGVLRRQLSHFEKSSVAQPALGPTAQAEDSPVETFSATIRATVEWGHALITGGWTNAAGKRIIVFAVPMKDRLLGANVGFQAQMVEMPEESVKALGLDRFLTNEGEEAMTGILGPDAYAVLVNELRNTARVDFLSAPVMTTLSGRPAQVSVIEQRQTVSGEEYSTGPTIDFTPTISGDGFSVDLEVTSVLNLPRVK